MRLPSTPWRPGEAEALAADGCASSWVFPLSWEAQRIQIPQEQVTFREIGLWVFIFVTLFA